jgi:tRNA threonylcarbamoyladenosine biosynthesis protein TsaB
VSAPSSSKSLTERGESEGVVVGFDTATADTVVCAARGAEVLHEERLGLAVAAVGGWEEVGAIAVGRGPGSFVGIRIGLATARGLAASTGLPAVGVCTLDALGRGLVESVRAGTPSLAVLDARRGEVFAALYADSGERIWEPFVALPAALGARLADLPAPTRAAGSGAVRFRDELASRGVEVPDDGDPVHRVAARHVCALASTAGGEGGSGLGPIYLRVPDAERWRERDDERTNE